MKIVYIGAGAAGRYCGACLHDNGLATALIKAGHEALLVPTFTPIRTDEHNVSLGRVFFGGVNVYLQEKSVLFRHTPWFLDAVLDSPRLLNWLSQRASGMDPKELGALTVSTLQGEHGRQSKELSKLVRWLARDVRPEIVHLSNSMLLGMAPAIRRALNVPIICSLMGEDIFLEQLTEPHYSQARQLLRERAAEIDQFVALNHYFADYMAEYLSIERHKIEVIPHGLNTTGHALRNHVEDGNITIGYFARVAAEKGLHYLIEAFGLLAKEPGLPSLTLKAAGYMASSDEPYLAMIQKRVDELGIRAQFHFAGELDRPAKIAFLQSLDLMSLPTVYHESKGISALEALANGVPLVVPRHGMFPELIEETGAGWLHEPENPQALADTLRAAALDHRARRQRGEQGYQAILARYTADAMAQQTIALYRRFLTARD